MDKLEKINKLLQDDISLEKYIKEIENEKIPIQTTNELQRKISSKINKKRKNRYADICKIAACLIFSLAVCRTDFIKEDNIKTNKNYEPKTTISINEKLSDFCKWVITPIEKEEEL